MKNKIRNKNICTLISISFYVLSIFSVELKHNCIISFSNYAKEKVCAIIDPPPINPPGNPDNPPIVPIDPFLPYLSNKKSYNIENAEVIGEHILNIAREFDNDATHLSSMDNFDENNYNCVTIDANNFINIMEDDSFSSMPEKVSAMRNAWIPDVPYEITHQELDLLDVDFPYPPGNINLHILVHGIGGSAYHWTNNGDTALRLNGSSLPYKLSEIFCSDVYCYKAQENRLYKFSSSGELENNYKILGYNSLTLSNNDIILYEDTQRSEFSNQMFYERFNQKMSYLKNTIMGGGKFCLYGHSRGGLINLIFATNHSSWIKNMYSLGTPYFTPQLSIFENIINSLPSSGSIAYLKQFIDNYFPYNDAYSDLSNVELMDNYRRAWNDVDHSSIHFKTYGFDTAVSFPTFICIGLFIFRIIHYVNIGFDGLVGSGNAIGSKTNLVTHLSTGFLNYVLPVYNATNTNENLEVDDSWTFDIPGIYLLSLQIFNSNKYLLSQPDSYAVAHNAETMYWEVINDIIQDLSNN